LSAGAAEILVIALSARALSASARAADYAPLAADLFCDLDLRETAVAWKRIDGDLAGGLEWEPLMTALDSLSAGRNPIGAVCGAGFEDRPALVERISERWPVIGNGSDAVARAKDPEVLATICRNFAIPHPRFSVAPQGDQEWLRKRRGGSGGAHVGAEGPAGDIYWQEQVNGGPVSALVLGTDGKAMVLGFSRQWPDPLPDAPFRYGGAVRPAMLGLAIEGALERAARDVVKELGLVGLNSVDFLVASDGWWLIEVNPRPGATLDIFEPPQGSLFALHVDACRGQLPENPPSFAGAAAAQTVYALRVIASMPPLSWPGWTADRQPPDTRVDAGTPLCTVFARAETVADARQLVQERAARVRAAAGADQ
jgi:predicted ATP-grasp superfamily ATP-dependent carboligase